MPLKQEVVLVQIDQVDADERDRIAAAQVDDGIAADLAGVVLHILKTVDRRHPGQADDVIGAGACREVGDGVVTITEHEKVVTAAADQHVITRRRVQRVIAIGPAAYDIDRWTVVPPMMV